MSGITPYDFVQKVYYQQEKVILDFVPSDDKFKEVLMEANMVLQELEGCEDWTWLREVRGYGYTGNTEDIKRRFSIKLDEDVYKPSTRYGDCVRLYRPTGLIDWRNRDGKNGLNRPMVCHPGHRFRIWPVHREYISVPFASIGSQNRLETAQTGFFDDVNREHVPLTASIRGDEIVFSRPFRGRELGKEIIVEVQRRIEPFHICDHTCTGIDPDRPIDYFGDEPNPCAIAARQERERMLHEIPDINYVIVKTACQHAEGSPVAQGRIAGLNDQAQRLLSTMRSNDSEATMPDYIDWNRTGFIDVI